MLDMTKEDFKVFVQRFLISEEEMREEKAIDYAGTTAFTNFLTSASITGKDPIQCAWVFMAKHLARVRKEIDNNNVVPIECLKDIRAYCLLIAAMQHDPSSEVF